jgi:hypothetical protein
MVDNVTELKANTFWFVPDRNGKPGEAVRVTNITNYLSAQNRIAYYYHDFTVMVWVKFNDNLTYQSIFDFNVGHETNNAWRFFLKNKSMQPSFQIDKDFVVSERNLSVNEWYHLAFVVEGVQARMYVNAERVAQKELKAAPVYVYRYLNNYIGRSHLRGQMVSNADFDEIKIYSRGLSEENLWEELRGSNLIIEL